MKFNYKSRKGFTLIELLVVIGILAVLAAIAIPSVAGLIDRANVSADKTNSNEMTNAVERFVSEYELYKQDVASGVLDTSNLDSAQGRVYNVTGITTRANIEKFESTGLGGKGVDIDTKYPANEETVKAVMQNYMKTSSSTFEPKQSDCQYYYSPEVGAVIVGETGATVSDLNNIYFSDSDDANADGTVQWICLDDTIDNIATDTKNTVATLQTPIIKSEIKQLSIKSNEHSNITITYRSDMTWQDWLQSDYFEPSFGLTTITDTHGNTYMTDNTMCTVCNKHNSSFVNGISTKQNLLAVQILYTDDAMGMILVKSERISIDTLIDATFPAESTYEFSSASYSFLCYDRECTYEMLL